MFDEKKSYLATGRKVYYVPYIKKRDKLICKIIGAYHYYTSRINKRTRPLASGRSTTNQLFVVKQILSKYDTDINQIIVDFRQAAHDYL